MLKLTILLTWNPSMTHDVSVASDQERHGPLFCGLPEVQEHVRRYVQCHAVPGEIPGMPPVTLDGPAELWLDEVAGLAALFTSESYMAKIRPDESKFLDLNGCQFITLTEKALTS